MHVILPWIQNQKKKKGEKKEKKLTTEEKEEAACSRPSSSPGGLAYTAPPSWPVNFQAWAVRGYKVVCYSIK